MSLTGEPSFRILDCVVEASVSLDSNICKYDVSCKMTRENAGEPQIWLMGQRMQFELLGATDSQGKLKVAEHHTKDFLCYELIPNVDTEVGEIYKYKVTYKNFVENVKNSKGLNTAVLTRSFGCHCDRYELKFKHNAKVRVLETCPKVNLVDKESRTKSIVFTNIAQAKPKSVSVTFDHGYIPMSFKKAVIFWSGLIASAAVGHYFSTILTYIKGIL